MRVQEADLSPARDPEVCVARLPRSVHGTPHHGYLERLGICLETLFDDNGEALDADVVTAARRAGDHHRSTLAEPERLEDLPRDLDLLDRVGCQRDAKGVTDPVGQERADPDGALDRPRERRAGLRNAEVKWIRHSRREHSIGADHCRDMRRLDRDLEVSIIQLLEELDLLERGSDERFGLVLLCETGEVLGKGAGVRSDSHGHPGLLRCPHDQLDLVGAADVAGVDPHRCHTCVDRAQSARRIEMDVRNHGNRREPDDPR